MCVCACRKYSSPATVLFNRLSFFCVCCFVLSVNFRWHLFCLLFVSLCTFEMFCYLAAVCVESVCIWWYIPPILTLIAISLVWFYASLRLKLARLSSSYSLHFGGDGKIFAFSLLSGWAVRTPYTHRHTWTHSEMLIANTINVRSLSPGSLFDSIRLVWIVCDIECWCTMYIHTRPIALQMMIRV